MASNRFDKHDWSSRVAFQDSDVLDIGDGHLLLRGLGGPPSLRLVNPAAAPASIIREASAARFSVVLDVSAGLEGVETLRGGELRLIGEAPGDIEALHSVSREFDHVNLTGVRGAKLKRVDGARIGDPRILEAPGVALRPGSVLGPRARVLIVENFRGADAQDLPRSDALRHLWVITARNLKTFEGSRSHLPQLVELALSGAPSLPGDTLSNLPPGLLALNLKSVSNLRSIDFIRSFDDLRHLFLTDCKDVASIAPLATLQSLRAFIANGTTKIIDGDLTPLIERQNPIRALLGGWRHYRPTTQEILDQLPEWQAVLPIIGRRDLDEYWPDRRGGREAVL